MSKTYVPKIVGKINSLSFIALESKDESYVGLVNMLFRGRYFSKEQLNESNTKVLRDTIRNIMLDLIYPLYLSHCSSKNVPVNLFSSVRVEMFSDKSKNIITFGRSAKIMGILKPIKPRKMKKGEDIFSDEIEKIESLYVEDQNPNSAIMLFLNLNGEWFGALDLTYNREISRAKYSDAKNFINSAIDNIAAKRYAPFYNDVHAAYELLIESVTLLTQITKERASHKKIADMFKKFCTDYSLSYYETYKIIREIRDDKRYSRESPHEIVNNAQQYLSNVLSFAEFSKKHLYNFQVPIDESTKINIDHLQNSDSSN